jgi:hypothetical protein
VVLLTLVITASYPSWRFATQVMRSRFTTSTLGICCE